MLIFPAPLFRVPNNEKSSPVSEMSPPFEVRLPRLSFPVALKLILPPLVDMVSELLEKLMVPPVAVKVTELPLPCCRLSRLSLRSLSEILLVARRTMLVDAETDSSVVSKMVVKVEAPLAVVEPDPFAMVMVSGSRRRVPVFPLAAVVSTDPSKYNSSFPETSTSPPSPKYFPPLPFTRPKNLILRSAQKMTFPPLPFVTASAKVWVSGPI